MSFEEMWRQAGDTSHFDPDPGTYKVRVIEAGAFYSKKGTECVKVELKVLDGEHAGKTFDHMMFFTNEIGAAISRESLVMYGVDPTKIGTFEDLIALIGGIENAVCEISVKINNGYTNVTVLSSRTGESDVPNEQGSFDVPETKPTSFAGAASRYGDDPPFD